MSKLLPLALVATGLTFAGVAGASAARLDIETYGNCNNVHGGTYGDGPDARLVIEGDCHDVEVAAGPCASETPRQAVLGAGRRHRVFVLPCD